MQVWDQGTDQPGSLVRLSYLSSRPTGIWCSFRVQALTCPGVRCNHTCGGTKHAQQGPGLKVGGVLLRLGAPHTVVGCSPLYGSLLLEQQIHLACYFEQACM